MTQGTPPKGSGPTVSFGSYVKPETVQETPEPDAIALPFISARGRNPKRSIAAVHQSRIDPMLVGLGLVGALTFLLGIMITMYFAKGDPAVVAELPAPTVGDAPAPAPRPATSDALASVVAASLGEDVTRNAPGDLITPTGAMSRASAAELSMTEILLGLQPERGAAPEGANVSKEILNRDKLQMLRDSVLAGKYTVKTVKRNGKDRLCLRVPKGNVTQDEAADLIMQAALRGEIELPPSLSTADGEFDADTLIFNLVQTSLANDGTEEGKRAAQEMAQRAFEASTAKTKKSTEVKGARVYVVEPGDSLAYISLQFYGAPSSYLKIFEANRKLLSSPDKIQIGQRLIIPS